jgi:hypothetical protein
MEDASSAYKMALKYLDKVCILISSSFLNLPTIKDLFKWDVLYSILYISDVESEPHPIPFWSRLEPHQTLNVFF